jgi:flagellar basal-body rod protein FlgB
MRKLTALTVALSLSAAGQAFAGSSAVSNALTGMNSSSMKIDAASNNIANANTAGYKPSAVEFQDVFAGQSGGQTKHLTSSSTAPPAMHGSTHSGRR